MNNNSKFDILMATYHKDDLELFKSAISTIFANTLQPNRIILVCDGPVYGELSNYVDSLERNPIFNIIKLPLNIGLAGALNAGLEHIESKFAFRCDADDFNHSDRFSKTLPFLLNGFDVVGSNIHEIDKSGVKLAKKIVPEEDLDIKKRMPHRNPINHMTVGFNVDSVKSAGGYPSLHLREDYGLWVKMASAEMQFHNIQECLVSATTGDNMYKRRGGLDYVISELSMQRFLRAHKFGGGSLSYLISMMKVLIYLSPNGLRKYFYLFFLREK